MKSRVIFGNQLITGFLLLFCICTFSQPKPELSIPEGINQEYLTILKSNDNLQSILNEHNSNKIIVWDLAENKQKYHVKLSAPINALAYHPSGKYIYIATEDMKVYILDSEDGNIISQRTGINYITNDFSPFINDKYLYINNNHAYIADLFSEEDEKIDVSIPDVYPNGANYDSENQKLLLFTGYTGIYIYDENLQPFSQKAIAYNFGDYYIFGDKFFSHDFSANEFKVYDLKSAELQNKTIVPQEQHSTFYNKTKKYIGHYQNQLFLYDNNNIVIKDLVSGKTIKSIRLQFKSINDIILSENKTSVLVHGEEPFIDEYGNDTTITNIHIYDLKDYSLKKIGNQTENRTNPNTLNTIATVFDKQNLFLFRFAEKHILKNSILTGALEKSYQPAKRKTIDTYTLPPVLIKDKFILISLQDENYQKSIACINANDNTVLWVFDEHLESTVKIKIDAQQEILTIIDEGYPNNAYFVLDIATGKIVFREKSEDRLMIYPINKNEILRLSTYQSGDWNTPVTELHISKFNVTNDDFITYKIPVENNGHVNNILQNSNNLYVIFNNQLISFELDDLSKVKTLLNLDNNNNNNNYQLIDIHDNKHLYIYNNTADKKFTAYDLSNNKALIKKEDFYFITYVKSLGKILLKNETNDLYIFNVSDQQFIQTTVNLSQTNLNRNFKIHHDKWLVYKSDKKEILYDLENNKVKHHFDDAFEVKSVSRDGNLYYNYGKLQYAKDGSDFVSLGNNLTIPQSMAEISFDSDSNEVIYYDDNGLLNILNLSNYQNNAFPNVLATSSYDRKYKRLSSNLFLTSSNAVHQILDFNTNKIVNLSDNASKISNLEVDKELLIMTENNKLRLFNLNSAEQIFEAESYNHRKLNTNLIIFQDKDEISLYSIKTNRILWKTAAPLYIGAGQFSPILDNTIFTTLKNNEIGALDLKTGKIKSRYTLLSDVFTLGSHLSIEPLSIHPKTKNLYVNIGNLSEFKYQVLNYSNDKFIEIDIQPENKLDISKLKTEYDITENDNFSLNTNILAVYKYHTKQFSIYNIQDKSRLFEQNLPIPDLTWDVLENENTVFIHNNSGDLFLIDYANKKTYNHKLLGNKFLLNNKRLFVSDYDKKIDVYDFGSIEKLTKLYSFIPLSYGEYMFYTDDGYYLSTKEASKNIQFKLDSSVYSFDQFDLIYNRPDLVLKAMQSTNSDLIKMYENAYQKRLKRIDYTITTSKESAPDILIANKNRANQTNENSFKINIKANAKTDQLSKIVITVNDNLYKEIPVSKKRISLTEEVLLNQGNNRIEVYALNDKKVKSISDSWEVFYKNEELKSPKVHFFGIGVSDYKNDDFDLKYSSKDIQDMAKALSDRYSDISINLLLDGDVTSENINRFKQKLSQTQTDDIVIISFCGHGVLDKNYNWYFATHDLDFNNPAERGFSYDNLMDLTNSVSSRQKLVTIDACHSGEIDIEDVNMENLDFDPELPNAPNLEAKDAPSKRGSIAIKATKDGGKTSFELMKQMFSDLEASNGTIVISASGGMEYAFEGGGYKNGVFTYSILDLLYNSVWNTLKISELQKTVIQNVEKLTNGKQLPNVRTTPLYYDWVIW